MLERATKRIRAVSSGEIIAIQGDIREIDLIKNQFDIVLAAAVMHHLRDEGEWEVVARAKFLDF
jgi:tRNA (cmo5U34)-methyltransferase